MGLLRPSFLAGWALAILSLLVANTSWGTVYNDCFVSAPTLVVSPGSVDFGSVNAGSSSTRTVTVTYQALCVNNPGAPSCVCNPPSSVTVTVGSSGSSAFTPLGSASFSLASGASRTVSIRFSPPAGTTDSYVGWVQFTPSSGSMKQISLGGVGYQAQANIDVTPTNLDFGEVQVGTTGSMTLRIQNLGDATLIGSLSASGGFSASTGSFTIAPSGYQDISVQLTPSYRGPYNGTLTITSNDPDAGSLPVGLTATGVAPYLSVTPTSISFGTVPVGELATATVTFHNESDSGHLNSATLTLSSFSISGPGFNFTDPGTISVPRGESRTLAVQFQPTSSGTKSGSLSFATNDPAYPTRAISLNGDAVAASIHPSTLDLSFGDIHIWQSRSLPLILSNTGSFPLVISGFSPNNATLSVTPPSATVAPGGSQGFTVTYSPRAYGALQLPSTFISGSLIVSSNDPQIPNLAIQKSGRGVSPITGAFDADPSTDAIDPLDLQAVYVGDSRTGNLSIKNDQLGNENLVIQNISSNSTSFAGTPPSQSIPPNQWGTFQVRFSPQSEGTEQATLTLTTNDVFQPTRTVTVSGTGVEDLDLSLSKLEVTQAIQNSSNSLPLILEKKTAVRAFVSSTIRGQPNASEIIRGVDGLLRIYRNGTEVAQSPMRSINGPIAARPNPDRNVSDDTLNFLIDGSLLSGAEGDHWRFAVELNPSSQTNALARVKENDYGNNVLEESLNLFRNYSPRIHYIPVSVLGGTLPKSADMISGTEMFKKIFPLSSFSYIRKPPLAFNQELSRTNDTSADALMEALFIASHLGGSTTPDRTYGWLSSNFGGEGRGYEPGRVAYGGVLPENFSWSQMVFAHELGHNYGLCHTHEPCNPYPDDGHDVLEDGILGEVGFDVATGAALPSLSYADHRTCINSNLQNCPGTGFVDLMSYAPYSRWISPQRYGLLFRFLRSREADPSGPFWGCRNGENNKYCLSRAPESSLLVTGSFSRSGEVTLHPIYTSQAVPDAPLSATADSLTIRTLDRDGHVLFETALTLGEPEHHPEEAASLFEAVIPDLPDMQTVQILSPEGVTLLERSRTGSAPILTLLSPASGEEIDQLLDVQWNASDPDGDPLTYSVLYSFDGGQTFQTIGVDLSTARLRYDAAQLPGGNNAMVRVLATDGLHTTTVDSPAFHLQTKSPELLITSPLEGRTYLAGAPISLEADARDPEDGVLAPEAVQWRSEIAGPLGQGNPLAVVLAEGDHVLQATATDADGNHVSQQVQIHVVNGARAPRANAGPDLLADEGETVVLDASESFDPDGDSSLLSYEWRQIGRPTVAIQDPTAAVTSFVAPQVETNTAIRFLLTVTDREGLTGTDTVETRINNAYYASLSIADPLLDFGSVDVGDTVTRMVTLSNDGNEPLEISDIQVGRGAFSVKPSSLTLAPSQTTAVTVTFEPTEKASYNTFVQIISNAVPGSATRLMVRGKTPDATSVYNDNSVGGDLLPADYVLPSPAESPVGSGAAPEPVADPGTFGFVGTGGCSLVH